MAHTLANGIVNARTQVAIKGKKHVNNSCEVDGARSGSTIPIHGKKNSFSWYANWVGETTVKSKSFNYILGQPWLKKGYMENNIQGGTNNVYFKKALSISLTPKANAVSLSKQCQHHA